MLSSVKEGMSQKVCRRRYVAAQKVFYNGNMLQKVCCRRYTVDGILQKVYCGRFWKKLYFS